MIVTPSEWNEFLGKHSDAHLLQTGAWGELKSCFGWQPVRIVSGGCGAQLLLRRLMAGFTVAYIPKGPLGSPPDAFWAEVDETCRAHRAVFLKVEPDGWESDTTGSSVRFHSAALSPYSIQPRRTLIVDLRGSSEEILARMKQKCRYNIRLAEKKGVCVRPWDDLKGFHRMMITTGARDEFGVHSLGYYQRAYDLLRPAGLVELLVAEHEGRPLAALMVALHGRRSWYLYGASTDEERNRMPTYLLQWEAMSWAKAHGAETYDLWGVPDEDQELLEAQFETRQDGMWGIYRFKRGFGGVLTRAAQALDRVYHPWLYRLYQWRMAGREAG